MAYVADLHIHSRYSRACSVNLNIPNLAKWAKFKGIDLLGTGDFLHPLWQSELKKDLTDLGNGFFEYDRIKFVLSVEVSCIYSENAKLRRIHTLILLPSFDSVAKLSQALSKKGAKLASDGRPILGMSSKQLCDIVFAVEPKAILIPAHIWTPWFSLFGSNSGYDSFNECFGEFSDQIYAIETGISSDPAMNWRITDLDKKSIVSFSDLHSLPRLGREVTIMGGQLSYESLRKSLQNQNIIGTIEFFPEEGKYHYSGHRKCEVILSTEELKTNGPICPVCEKPLTIGVLQRIEDLATRTEDQLKLFKKDGVTKSKTFPAKPGFRMLVQLEEIIAESFGMTVNAQKVQNEYLRLVTTLDNELKILTKTPLDLISLTAGEKIAEGVKRVREGKLKIKPGYDNTYGIVKIFSDEDNKSDEEQIELF